MMSKEIYKHTQIAWWIPISYVIVILALISIGLIEGIPQFFIAIIITFVVSVVALLLFFTLTVIVDNDFVKIKFSLGVIKKSFKLADIRSCSIVRNQWWHGWGIHWFPNGILFNVSGLDAVQLTMKSGTIYRIGTDEPQKLDLVIQSKLIKGK